MCNYIGTTGYADAMNWTGSQAFRHAKWVPWPGVNPAPNPAGLYRSAQTLTQLIVADAGHMSPYDQPANVQEMVYRWMKGGFAPTAPDMVDQ